MKEKLLFQFTMVPTGTKVNVHAWPHYGVVTDCWTTNGSIGYVAHLLYEGYTGGIYSVPDGWVEYMTCAADLKKALKVAYEEAFPSIGVSNFVRRQTPQSSYSHFEGTWSELVTLVEEHFDEGKQGYKPGVWLVPVPAERFRSNIVALTPNTPLTAHYAPRREGEAPFINVRAQGGTTPAGEKMPAKHAFVVLYSHAVLCEGGEASTDANWEIVSINARTEDAESPMDPMTMARNFLFLPGGTRGEFTAQQFAESIVYWNQHALVAERES